MNSGKGIDVAEVVRVLGAVGVDETTVRDQLAMASTQGEQAEEVAALLVESEHGVLVPLGAEIDVALFDVAEALRAAGLSISLGQTSTAPALVLGRPPAQVYEVELSPEVSEAALASALSSILPDTHRVLVAPDYEPGEMLALVALDREQHARLHAAIGGDALTAVLVTPSVDGPPVAIRSVAAERLLAPDFAQRFRARMPEPSQSPAFDAAFQKVQRYDARVAWPEGSRRPPGDDLLELTAALAGEPLSRALAAEDSAELANVLYRFALTTTVGAHWDVLAARQNPGMSAQGVLGFGQLSWAYFVFAALGADAEAARAGRLLDSDWVRGQERGTVSARQRAWFDLGAFLRHGTRGASLGRVAELLPLMERAAWQDPAQVYTALAVHTEPRGDLLTHQPLYHVWPAPLYALARRASALDLLPAGNPFLSRPLDVAQVDEAHALVQWLGKQLSRFDAMDEASLPPLLDPLPVIVEARVTEVDALHAHGRTQLTGRDEAEHHVVAPHDGRAMKPGEVWYFEVQGSRQTRARARHEGLGEVSFHIALPTGQWLSRVDAPGSPPVR